MATVTVTHFTDPACPFAYSAEPQIKRLQWRYGAQLEWKTRLVGLAASREEYAEKGLTPELMAQGYANLEGQIGMPFDLSPRSAVPASLPACREVVAARVHGGEALAESLLRQLRLQALAKGLLLDELHTLREASHAAGIDSHDLDEWAKSPDTEAALASDMKAARHPDPSALHLTNKLARWEGGWRYTCPSLVLDSGGDEVATIAGFVPATAYDVVFANFAPQLERAEPATDPAAVLEWATEPLATAEVAAILETGRDEARAKLIDAGATEHPLGTDALWTL